MDDEEVLRRLSNHPERRNRIASLLSAVDDTGGNLKLADDAEIRLTQELQRIGQAVMQAWSSAQGYATRHTGSAQLTARGFSRLLERVLIDPKNRSCLI